MLLSSNIATSDVAGAAGSLPTTGTTFSGNAGIPNATIVLEVEQADEPDAQGVPTRLIDTVVATSRADADGNFTVALPDTPTVEQAGSDGWVNTVTVARSGLRMGVSHNSAPTPGSASASRGAESLDAGDGSTGTTVKENSFVTTTLTAAQAAAMDSAAPANGSAATASAVRPDSATGGVVPEDNTRCYWVRIAKQAHGSRIGELHVADAAGSTGQFEYGIRADSVFTVGFRYSSDDGWSASGSATVDNAIDAGGGFTRGRNFRGYAADSMDYGKFSASGVPGPTCVPGSQRTEALASSGDAYVSAVRTPPAAPWPSCHASPYSIAIVPVGGYYYNKKTHAADYSLVANLWGFQFGGRTGYTDHIRIKLMNNGASRTFACGSRDINKGVPILYNKKW